MFFNSKILVSDLTGFNFEGVEDDNKLSEIFYYFYKKFLNIKDIKGKNAFINQINNLETKSSMYLCFNDVNIMSKIDKTMTICCEFNIENKICDSSNYFSLYYGNSVSYNSGFENDNRKEISFFII